MQTRNTWLFLPLSLLLAACAPAADEAAAERADTADTASQGVDALRADYVEHYNMGHPDMVAEMYAEDAVGLMADGSVLLGRDAIAAALAEQMADASPELSLDQIDEMLFGDTVISIGRWSVTVTPEQGADPVTREGHYMVSHTPDEDGWEIGGVITNYDSQQPPEALQGTMSDEAPEEESILGSFSEAYEAAWNAGDAEAVAALYTEDTWAALGNAPVAEGRAAVQQAMEQRVRGEIDIHGVGSADLGDGWVLDGGWFEVSGASDGDYVGTYWTLSQADADGERRIHWMVSNGRPKSVAASAAAM